MRAILLTSTLCVGFRLWHWLVSAPGVAILLLNPALTIDNQIAVAATLATSCYALRTVSQLGHVVQDPLSQKATADEFPGNQRTAAKTMPFERDMEHTARL